MARGAGVRQQDDTLEERGDASSARAGRVMPGKRTLSSAIQRKERGHVAERAAASAPPAAATAQLLDDPFGLHNEAAPAAGHADAPVQLRRGTVAGSDAGTDDGTAGTSAANALPDAVRTQMESAFSADFSNVRVREDARATALGADAFLFPKIDSPAQVIEAEYQSPYLNHATMEPQTCTAWFRPDGFLEVWTSTQNGEASMAAAAAAAGLPLEQVEVHKMMLGGGFGRRGAPQDFVRLGVLVAKAMPGTPVKTMWNRAEDMQHGYYRPASLVRMKAGLDAGGEAGPLHLSRAAIIAQLSGDSPILRHALRLAAATGLGVALARGIGLGHGEWIALTVLLALRPETAHTYTRCISRVVGVLAGVLVATIVTGLLQPAGPLAAVPAVIALGLSYGLAGLGAVPMTGALAMGIVFLLDIQGAVDSADLSQRLVAVVLGGGLAVASHVVLPDRSMVRLRQRAGELLKAEIDYAATVIRGFVHPIPHAASTLNTAWQRAVRARSAFEAASGSLRAEAPEVRRWLSSYRAALNAVTGACVALEDKVAGAHPERLDPRFVVAVDDYVDALRGEPPTAGQPWIVDARHLSETDQQLRDAAGLLERQDTAQRVLLTETETISRYLLGLDVSRR